MSKIFFFLFIIFLCVNILFSEELKVVKVWNPEQKIYSDIIDGEILIKFKGNQNNFAPSILRSSKKTAQISGNIYKYKINDSSQIFEIINDLLKEPNIEWAQPNYAYKLYSSSLVNDPDFGDTQWYLEYIGIPEVWQFITGATSDIIIAVLDSGIDTSHPDLQGRIYENTKEINGLPDVDDDNNGYIDDKYGLDAYYATLVSDNGTSDNYFDDIIKNNFPPIDFVGHGTACASIIGAATNNGIGMSGIFWGGKILNVRCGITPYLSTEAIYKGIAYATRMGAKIINMSFGSNSYDRIEEQIINEAYNRGILLIAAAGNEGNDYASYPAKYGNVISVGAIGRDGIKTSFTNYKNDVDFMAPGKDIYACTIVKTGADLYEYMDGTSFAAPIVCGAAALLLTYDPSLKTWEIREILKSGCQPVDSNYGAGIINLVNSFRQYSEFGRGASQMQNKKVINYPNPFSYVKNNFITFKALSKTTSMSIKIFSISGKLIKEIKANDPAVGDYDNDGSVEIQWNGLDNDGKVCSPGIYFFISTVDNGIDWGKLTLISW